MKHRLDRALLGRLPPCVLAGLVYLDVLAFLVLAVSGIGLLHRLRLGDAALCRGCLLLLALVVVLAWEKRRHG